MKNTGCLGSALAAIGFEVFAWVIPPILMMGCFVVFDRLHIRETWQHVAFLISPLLLVAFLVWRRDGFKPRDPPEQ